MITPPGSTGRHRQPADQPGRTAPGRATLVGILACLSILLGSGVGISLTSGGSSAGETDPPEVVTALGYAPTPTLPPTPSPEPEPEPASEPEPEPEPAPPPPPPPAPAQPPTDEVTAQEDEVTAITNQERAAAGCDPLVTDERLRTAARGHSQDMATNDYFSHTGLNGSSPGDRMRDAGYPQPGGENIAYGYRTPADVMDGWMNSEGHRNNLLSCGYTTIGVGLAYDGSGRPYWTQNFGR